MSFPSSSAQPHPQAAFLERHSDTVKCHKFIEEGRRIITGSRDGSLQVWEVDTDSLVGEPRTDAGSGAVHAVAVSRNHKKIFTGSQDGRMRTWEGLAGKMDRAWKKEHTAAILTICLSPDELYLASGSEDGTVVIWDARIGKIIGEPIKTDHRHVYAVHYSPDGKTLVTSGYNKSAISWDVGTREALRIESFSDLQSVRSHSDVRDIPIVHTCANNLDYRATQRVRREGLHGMQFHNYHRDFLTAHKSVFQCVAISFCDNVPDTYTRT
jgi:WD40 repeat protein